MKYPPANWSLERRVLAHTFGGKRNLFLVVYSVKFELIEEF